MMTDREEFEKWLKENYTKGYITDSDRKLAKGAWQARGALDAVKIKELEGIIAMQKETIQTLNSCIGGEGSLTTDNLVTIGRLEERIAEYEVIDKGQIERIKELESDLDDRKREVNLRCGQIQERDIRIAELTAKLDKAKEALHNISNNWSEADAIAVNAIRELDK